MNFRNIIIVFLFFLFGHISVSAQHVHKSFNVEQFKKDKTDFIVQEVGLTPEEAAVFMPLMNELLDKRFQLNRRVRIESRKLREIKNPTAADYDRLMNLSLHTAIAEAALNQEYYQKFKAVISPDKIFKSQKAEEKFMKQTVNKMGRKKQKEKND